jgi:hypothetical protein
VASLELAAAPESPMRRLRLFGLLASAMLLSGCVIAAETRPIYGYGYGYGYGRPYYAPAPVYRPAPVWRPYAYGPPAYRPYAYRPHAYAPPPGWAGRPGWGPPGRRYDRW